MIALIIAPVTTYVIICLIGPHGLRSVQPHWLRSVLEALIVLGAMGAVMVPAYYAVKALVWRINNRFISRYERDEASLKRVIVANPVFRRLLVAFIMLVYTGYCVYFAIFALSTLFKGLSIPGWGISLFRDIMILGFVVAIPSFYVVLRGYLEGATCLAEWSLKYRKLIRLANFLAYSAIATMGVASLWSIINLTR